MPKTSTVVAKCFAALLAIGVGAVGGFNYVTGGNVFGTGNDYPMLPPPTRISSVASGYDQIDPVAPTAYSNTPTTTPTTTPDQTDGSCCASVGRAGLLIQSQTGTTDPDQAADQSDDQPQPVVSTEPPASEG